MKFVPRPRFLFLIALALAIPTWGISLAVFFLVFKRHYDSKGTSAILAASKTALRTRRAEQVFRVNKAAIDRVFTKYASPVHSENLGLTLPHVRWGVLQHPMINSGQPFTLRTDTLDGEVVNVEAGPGKAWWLLTDRLWLGRRGTAPGIPHSMNLRADNDFEDRFCTAPEDTAMALLILELEHGEGEVVLSTPDYDWIGDWAQNNHFSVEFFPNYSRMRIFLYIGQNGYWLSVTNMEPEKKGAGSVRLRASCVKKRAVISVETNF